MINLCGNPKFTAVSDEMDYSREVLLEKRLEYETTVLENRLMNGPRARQTVTTDRTGPKE